MKKRLVIAAIGVVLSTMTLADDLNLEITSPADGSSVGQRPIIQGNVTDPTASVWVVVHPLEVSDYWVQPRVTVRDSGSWKVQIHIGRPGPVDVGKLFEVRAVADPDVDLREGKVLDHWPNAAAISDLVELTRK